MTRRTLSQILTDAPVNPLMNWGGFSNKKDKTMLPSNWLVPPSINCFIPDGDKIIPREGTQKVFQGNTPVLDNGTIGGYTKFKNFAGIEMDVKAYRDATEGEQIYVTFNDVYVPITINPNLTLNGTGRIYFSTYTDTDLDFSQSKRLPRLCWVNGYEHTDDTGRVFSWTGGIADINAVGANTISLPAGQTWRKLGFTVNKAGTAIDVTVEGVQYSSASLAELDSNTLTIGAHALTAGMVVTSSVEVDDLVASMENLKSNKNYMYYGNEKLRQLYMSNAFNRPGRLVDQTYNSRSGLNDAIFSGTYTGLTSKLFTVTIDNELETGLTFTGTGANAMIWDYATWNFVVGQNQYRVVIDHVRDPVTGYLGRLAYYFYANGVNVFGGFLQDAAGAPTGGTFVAVDGMTLTFPDFAIGSTININTASAEYTGTFKSGDSYTLVIGDTFSWSLNGVPQASKIPVTGVAQVLTDGVSVQLTQKTGHAKGDTWSVIGSPEIIRSWANFYYELDLNSENSVRRPGEGYIYDLPSNFWAFGTLEESLYVNTSNGEWGYTSPTLSADLLSEDISFVPLKQVTSSKVLYPYLIGSNRNDLIFIDENKNLTSLGRIILVEKLQMEDMSDFIRDSFKNSSFVNGSIVFQDDKTWITSPEDNLMLCYDERTEYWQPPQFIPNLGLLTIIGVDLYVHSHLDTATRSLNDPTALGDDGVEYEVIARASTYDHGDRWNKKTANMAFWEGYVDEAPPMKMRVYFDVDGCSGIAEEDIAPMYCTDVINHGNFGGGQDGGHEFGGDETHRTNYARWQFNNLGVRNFYFSSLEFRCRAKNHSYEILSMGINLAQSKLNNKEYRTPESDVDQLLPL